MTSLDKLREEVKAAKAASLMSKAAHVDAVLEALVVVVEDQQRQINELRQGGEE